MINKQSFSVNPRDLKKSSSNNTGSGDGGNFMQILNQYTREQDMKQTQFAGGVGNLVSENEFLLKENEMLRQALAEKDKKNSDQEI
jgi:hypothetical protein